MKFINLKYASLTVLTLISQVLSIPIISPGGCCISCGYTYCDTLLECIRPWEVECPKLINPFINKNILDINNEVGSI
jgi:hypothetical protein